MKFLFVVNSRVNIKRGKNEEVGSNRRGGKASAPAGHIDINFSNIRISLQTGDFRSPSH